MKHKTYIMGFWERMEEAVGYSGLTKVEIAKRVGCDRKLLNKNHGADDRMLNSGTLAKFCAVTNVSSDYILGLTSTKRIRGV